MLSEPKSKQGTEKDVHQFVVLNHILFSNIAIAATRVFQRKRVYPPGLIRAAKKSKSNILNEVRKKLGEEIPVTSEALKKTSPAANWTTDDLLIKEQLDFIYNLQMTWKKQRMQLLAEKPLYSQFISFQSQTKNASN